MSTLEIRELSRYNQASNSLPIPVDADARASLLSALKILQSNLKTAEKPLKLALQLVLSGAIISLLHMAQQTHRTPDFKPLLTISQVTLDLSDAALLLLGEICNCSLLVLQYHGWEVKEDEDGRCVYFNPETEVVQRDAPELDLEDVKVDEEWTGQLMLELPLLVAPYIVNGELTWPVKVEFLGKDLAVLDVIELVDGATTTSKQMVIGTWKGLSGFRETEIDTSYPLGQHLENWYTCTLAGLCLATPMGPKKEVLVVGCGGGALPAFLKRHDRGMDVVVVEIRADVAMAARSHFKLDACDPPAEPEEGQISLYVQDISDFATTTARKFDAILLDVYTNAEFPPALISSEFFTSLLALLKPESTNAVLAMNAGVGATAFTIRDILKSCRTALPTSSLITYHDLTRAGPDEENLVFSISRGPVLGTDAWHRTLELLESDEANVAMPFTIEGLVRRGKDDVAVNWGFYDPKEEEVAEERVAVKVAERIEAVVRLDKDDAAWSLFD